MKTNQSERKAINERCCYRSLENGKRRLIWEITSRCNLNCRHCFVSTNSTEDVSLQDCLRMVDLIKKNGTFGKIMITGGEPFARGDIFEILAYIKKSLPEIIVDLTTNMTLLDESSIRRLAQIGIDELTVSLDGVGEIHDRIRGLQGSFDHTTENIRLARGQGLFIDVVTVVSRMNVDHLRAIAATAVELECSSLTFSAIIERQEKNLDQGLLLDSAGVSQAMSDIEECRQRYAGSFPIRLVGFRAPFPFLCTKDSVLSISSDGWIERCLLSRTSTHQRNIKDLDLSSDALEIASSSPSECF